ncbi:hypothetical protein EMIHUDRAFT_215637 [Emiliania huxleyi CCMP1516]|uniref:Uncharacterized protein n=2 Tax=Emiliania huxleyi TaxID=2903 RepID=A0A0D3IGQ0_EMIH1|nr:hypothetical protein EMIHUDRAFT_215637 [Emiliania huxleyi CCMP1516]EOD10435.1 hypothetical protein EMIHUDRAFT_215637 [Emiliania huxleyi CCMP1516]|eukprot:XP_005762864.1 hypothetical protein EMIHUDRAFT_215637 [Emiliania huxleyi CCMP1516]
MGAFVACGNTLPRARETVLGVEGGDRGGRVGMWDPRTGTGTVEAVKGQYTDAEGKCRVEALLFEEFGAMSGDIVVGARMDAVCAAATVGTAGGASGMGGSKGKGAGGAQ